MLLAIDPGTDTGWAMWDRAELSGCGLVHWDETLASVCKPGLSHMPSWPSCVWIEFPVIYPRAKARPNDILQLAKCAAEYGGVWRDTGAKVHYVAPAVWKGQVPKQVHHARVWAALSQHAQTLVDKAVRGLAPSKRHNVLDAVALGLWASKKVNP